MRKGQIWIGVISGILLFFLIMAPYWIRELAYKQGQLDCLNGIIKYELKQQANGESIWVEKK